MGITEAEAHQLVRGQGFKTCYTWSDRPRAHYSAHKHAGKTTHIVLSGSLEYSYPDEGPARYHCAAGETWEVAANRVHEVWVSSEGATYVIGE